MSKVKKTGNINLSIIEKSEVFEMLEIKEMFFSQENEVENHYLDKKMKSFKSKYNRLFSDTMIEVWRWRLNIFKGGQKIAYEDLYKLYNESVNKTRTEPVKVIKYERIYSPQTIPIGSDIRSGWLDSGYVYREIGYEWIFNENTYEVSDKFKDEQARLLILEDFDNERSYFEKLQIKFAKNSATGTNSYERRRIPENVRIEVWRRDGGRCARCGSRERLEYDHIVPISKGGSNTARNIELLCEKCNRSKSNNIV
jgi:hypothetical protein